MANTPKLPKAIGNNISTTLSGSITNSATSITVSDATGMETDGGYIIIDEGVSGKEEVVHVESISGNTLTISADGRGQQGTSGVAHDSGATVTDILVKDHVNGLIDNGLYLRKTNGTEVAAVLVNSDGDVVVGSSSSDDVILNNKTQSSAYLGSNQTNIPDTTLTVIQLATELFDDGADFDISTYRFTVPKNGTYLIQGQIQFGNIVADKAYIGSIYKNGTASGTELVQNVQTASLAFAVTCNLSKIVKLVQGDYLELVAQQLSGVGTVSATAGENATFMVVKLLSA